MVVIDQTDRRVATRSDTGSLLVMGVGSGIATGFIEAAGLLFFQRLNWARWGPMVHVSKGIFWISPIIDLIFFLSLALICALVARFLARFPPVRALVFLLAFLSVYDWLTVTGRLYHRACLLLALGTAVALVRWSARRESSILQFWKKATLGMLAMWMLVFAGIQGGKWLHEQSAVARLPRATPGMPNVLVIVVDTTHLLDVGLWLLGEPIGRIDSFMPPLDPNTVIPFAAACW